MRPPLAVLALALAAPAPAPGENVLLIMADDLNTMVGAYGHPLVQTPHIDRLAEMGVVFDRAYAQQAFCGPSRASIFSGLYPWTSGVGASNRVPTIRHALPDREFLAGSFRRAGYHTASYGKVDHWPDGEASWHVVERPERYSVLTTIDGYVWPGMPTRPPGQLHTDRPALAAWGTTGDLRVQGWNSPDAQFVDGQTAARAAGAIRDARARGEPFFVGAGFFCPHAPYIVPQRFLDLYDPGAIPLAPEPPYEEQQLSFFELPGRSNRGLPVATPAERREVIAGYLAAVSYMDHCVGQLFGVLDELALWDDTIVVFMSDHGVMLGEHGIGWMKQKLWDECLHIPFIIYDPGSAAAGRRCGRVVQAVDLYPTLLELAGVAPPDQRFDGVSLGHLVADPGADHAVPAVAGRPNPTTVPGLWGRALTTGDYRYCEWTDGKRTLFNLADDPQELDNLLATDPGALGLADLLAAQFPPETALGRPSYFVTSDRGYTSPGWFADRDGDGISDELEIDFYRSDPVDEDSDGDGLRDPSELALAEFGFDIATPDGDRIGTLRRFRDELGLYSRDDIAGLAPKVTLHDLDHPGDGVALELSVESSADGALWEPVGGAWETTGPASWRWRGAPPQGSRLFRLDSRVEIGEGGGRP